jgi:hypothetical protein
MTWDATNSRLGIGTNTPAVDLHLKKSGTVISTIETTTTTGRTISQSVASASIYLDWRAHGASYTSAGETWFGQNPAGLLTFASNGGKFVIGTYDSRDFILGSANTERARITSGGNFIINNSTTDSGERLQVTGTMKVTGASSFGANMTLALNQNAQTIFNVTNTALGASSISTIRVTSSNGYFEHSKQSNTTTAYKILLANDSYIYNATSGDISILNDVATGNIKFAAGASSTAHMTIKSNGRINMSSLPTSSTGLSTGDLWNDAGTIKIV